MILVTPKFEILNSRGFSSIQDAKKHIEVCGRVCYKSEEKITEDSHERFWNDVVVKKQHKSIMEHASMSRIFTADEMLKMMDLMCIHCDFTFLKYFKTTEINDNMIMMTGNLRAWEELDLRLEGINKEYISDSDLPLKHKMITVKFTTDLGISHEMVRHRIMSFSQESSRYCNYFDSRFDNQLRFVNIDTAKPYFKLKNVTDYQSGVKHYNYIIQQIEYSYNNLISLGFPAEWARSILPKCTKTEIIISAYVEDWWKFFSLRTAVTAHPQMREVVIPLQETFTLNGWKY